MKKIALLLAVLLIGSSAFAVGMKCKMGYGVQGLTITTNNITMPTVQYYFEDDTVGELGLSLATLSTGSVTNLTIALGFKKNLGDAVGGIQPHWGAALAYTSCPAMVANTTNLLLAINVGAKYFVTDNLCLEGNLVPLAYNSFSVGGATTTRLSILNSANALPAATFGMHVYL